MLGDESVCILRGRLDNSTALKWGDGTIGGENLLAVRTDARWGSGQ